LSYCCRFFFFQAEDGIRDFHVTGVQTCALPILPMTAVAAPRSRFHRALLAEGGARCWNRQDNHVSRRSLSTPRLPILILAAAGLLAAAAVHAGEVYQWKDANGITHYSQTPPPKGSYQQRAISGDRAGSAQPVAAQAAAEDPRCATAQANVAALASGRPVHEAGEEGQPGRALNDAERASQTEL